MSVAEHEPDKAEGPEGIAAATVVIFRRAPDGGPPQLLMQVRSRSLAFAGGSRTPRAESDPVRGPIGRERDASWAPQPDPDACRPFRSVVPRSRRLLDHDIRGAATGGGQHLRIGDGRKRHPFF